MRRLRACARAHPMTAIERLRAIYNNPRPMPSEDRVRDVPAAVLELAARIEKLEERPCGDGAISAASERDEDSRSTAGATGKVESSPSPSAPNASKSLKPNDTDERIYPCRECGVMRSEAEGGTTFTVCDKCWDQAHGKTVAPSP